VQRAAAAAGAARQLDMRCTPHQSQETSLQWESGCMTHQGQHVHMEERLHDTSEPGWLFGGKQQGFSDFKF
jgi:hypothetical protein